MHYNRNETYVIQRNVDLRPLYLPRLIVSVVMEGGDYGGQKVTV